MRKHFEILKSASQRRLLVIQPASWRFMRHLLQWSWFRVLNQAEGLSTMLCIWRIEYARMTNWGRANSVLAIFCVIITHIRITHGHTHRLRSEQHVAFTNPASWYNSLPTGKIGERQLTVTRVIHRERSQLSQRPSVNILPIGNSSEEECPTPLQPSTGVLITLIWLLWSLVFTVRRDSSQAGNIEILFGALGAGFTVSWAEFILQSLSFVESSLMFFNQIA